MKRNIYLYLILLLQVVFVTACYNEDDLTPSGIESRYMVPQGNHDYDATIVDFYEKYGSCLLYKFTDKDTYWTPSEWMNGALGEEGKDGYIVSPADEAYVGEQLELLQDTWFSSYSDEFLSAFLPVKIMLCSSIDSVCMTWVFEPEFMTIYTSKKVGAWYNYDNICVSYGSEEVTQMTEADVAAFRSKVNRIFIESMKGREVTVPTKEFEEMSDYNVDNIGYMSPPELWALGVPIARSYNVSVENDWEAFMLMMVNYPESFLTREPVFNSEWDTTEANWDGILNPVKDVNGLLKARYDYVRNYFIENYNMDLQSVGNKVKI